MKYEARTAHTAIFYIVAAAAAAGMITAGAATKASRPTTAALRAEARAMAGTADLLGPQKNGKQRRGNTTPMVLSPALMAAAPTAGDVGDPDSFGKAVTYLGVAQTLSISIVDDCTGVDPTVERCVVTQPAPLPTSFDEAGIATMNLPAKASKSLICFALTPVSLVLWNNDTGTQQNAGFDGIADITIDNPVLDDPALIDPTTSLPFGGSMYVGLWGGWSANKTLEQGQSEEARSMQTRSCLAGLISKRVLIEDYGLSEAQATLFFKKPMTIHFGAHGFVQSSTFTNYFYGIRLYGD